MRASDLLSPGILSNSQTLRHETAHAISRGEINMGRGSEGTLEDLAAFFTNCALLTNEIITDMTPTAAQSTAAAVPATILADNIETSTVTFTIKNDEGTGLAQIPISVVATGTAVGAVLSPLTGVTNGAGVFAVTVRGPGEGTVILTATVATRGVSFTEAATVTLDNTP